MTQQPTTTPSLSITDPKRYEGIKWSSDVRSTMTQGVPAWGQGKFSSALAYGLCLFSCLGISGLHRIYMGDLMCGITWCLTGGWCGIGDLIDLCYIPSRINAMNAEINRKSKKRAAIIAEQQAQQQIIVQQVPVYYAQPPPLPPNYPYASPAYAPPNAPLPESPYMPGYVAAAPGQAYSSPVAPAYPIYVAVQPQPVGVNLKE
ncbi:hypothetical protein BLNAU_18061 [Blattamonas nauphoetae]|uniref:TM2 domain-containing protein n=1 Tax=Blattamonas nauphoetae TaxID=2049346 RepID=A0ABQ9X9U8_9EUKA|nr:hypothetical protein BLNAU_18061 [Blattamonas nauphoetae]